MWHMPQGVQCDPPQVRWKASPELLSVQSESSTTNESAAVANPTPAQVAGVPASLKKAQAVLLAAKVDYNVTEPELHALPASISI